MQFTDPTLNVLAVPALLLVVFAPWLPDVHPLADVHVPHLHAVTACLLLNEHAQPPDVLALVEVSALALLVFSLEVIQ